MQLEVSKRKRQWKKNRKKVHVYRSFIGDQRSTRKMLSFFFLFELLYKLHSNRAKHIAGTILRVSSSGQKQCSSGALVPFHKKTLFLLFYFSCTTNQPEGETKPQTSYKHFSGSSHSKINPQKKKANFISQKKKIAFVQFHNANNNFTHP